MILVSGFDADPDDGQCFEIETKPKQLKMPNNIKKCEYFLICSVLNKMNAYTATLHNPYV